MSVSVMFMNLLQLLNTEYQEQALIRQLNNYFNIDHNLYLLDPSADFNRFIASGHGECTPQSIFTFENISHSVAGLKLRDKVRGKNELLVVVPQNLSFIGSLDILTRVKQIQKQNLNIKVGVYYSHITSDDLRRLFEWAWKNRIINIFVASYSRDCRKLLNENQCSLWIFSYNPFGTFDVLNVTGQTFDNFFLSQKSNFQQYKLKIGYKEPTNWSNHIKAWDVVYRLINSSYSYLDQSASMNGILEHPDVDIFPTVYTKGKTHPNFIYTWAMPVMAILVPEALPYSEFLVYFKKMIANELFDLYFLIAIITVLILLIILRYKNQQKIMCLQSGADVLNLLISDNSNIKYQQLHRTEVYLIVPLTFTGIVIVNVLLSNVQSLLTAPYLQPQIKSTDDIYRSSLTILTSDRNNQRWLIDVLNDRTTWQDWGPKVGYVSNSELARKHDYFNTSAAYLTSEEKAKQLLRIQKKLQMRGYHIVETGFFGFQLFYLVNPEFQFIERLNEIFHRIKSAGLDQLWDYQGQIWSEKSLVKENLKRLTSQKGRNSYEDLIDSVKFKILILLFYGHLASTVLFALEIISFRLLKCFSEQNLC